MSLRDALPAVHLAPDEIVKGEYLPPEPVVAEQERADLYNAGAGRPFSQSSWHRADGSRLGSIMPEPDRASDPEWYFIHAFADQDGVDQMHITPGVNPPKVSLTPEDPRPDHVVDARS